MDGIELKNKYKEIIEFSQNEIETKELSEKQYQQLTQLKEQLTLAIRKIDNIAFKGNGVQFKKFNNSLEASNQSLLADINKFEKICNTIRTVSAAVTVVADFIEIGTKLASYAA